MIFVITSVWAHPIFSVRLTYFILFFVFLLRVYICTESFITNWYESYRSAVMLYAAESKLYNPRKCLDRTQTHTHGTQTLSTPLLHSEVIRIFVACVIYRQCFAYINHTLHEKNQKELYVNRFQWMWCEIFIYWLNWKVYCFKVFLYINLIVCLDYYYLCVFEIVNNFIQQKYCKELI